MYSNKKGSRVAVVYTHFPHYRQAVFDALMDEGAYDYHFFYDRAGGGHATIRGGAPREGHYNLPLFRIGPLQFQFSALRLAFSGRYDAFIFLGNPFVLTTWVAAAIARCRGKLVYFWTHGWLRHEKGGVALLRKAFYRLANHLLVYGSRAVEIGRGSGYPEERIHVVYNSLDYSLQSSLRNRLLLQGVKLPERHLPFFLVVGRLIPALEVDLALDALELSGVNAELVIVGDGPERSRLEHEVNRRGLRVCFLGAIYDEEELAKLFMGACAVISPGKVGLLAMHALSYGAPVLTHGDLERQMPEVEAVLPGVTGAFFERGDARSLGALMISVLDGSEGKRLLIEGGAATWTVIERRYTASVQVGLIEQALSIESIKAIS